MFPILGILVLLSPLPYYGEVVKGCDNKYYAKWNNIPANFELQTTYNLTNPNWTNLVSIRDNVSMKNFEHPLTSSNDVKFFRLLILP